MIRAFCFSPTPNPPAVQCHQATQKAVWQFFIIAPLRKNWKHVTDKHCIWEMQTVKTVYHPIQDLFDDSLFLTNLLHKLFLLIHLLYSSTCFEHYYAHIQDDKIVLVRLLVSSLSLGDCTVHRLQESSRNLCTVQSPKESDDTRSRTNTILSSWRWA